MNNNEELIQTLGIPNSEFDHWYNSELGIPTFEQERNYYPDKNVNYHLQCMQRFRIQELERVGRY